MNLAAHQKKKNPRRSRRKRKESVVRRTIRKEKRNGEHSPKKSGSLSSVVWIVE